MFDTFLTTTNTEGLKPLGTPHQRSYELVSGIVRQKLGPRHAAMFAEPVATEFGDKIDWYAAEADGSATPLSQLSEGVRAAVLADLESLCNDVRAEAQTLAQSKNNDDQRLGEAMLFALEYPGADCIFAVDTGTSSAPQPVVVNWAWTSDHQEVVRGVLSGTDRRAEAEAQREAEEAARLAAIAAAAPITPVAATQVRRQGSGLLGWILLWLGWLLLAIMLGVILWLILPACALNLPFLQRHCPPPEQERLAALAATDVLHDEIAQLEHSIAVADRACQPPPPPPPPPPPEPVPEPVPEPPAQIPNPFENMPTAPEPQQESEIDRRLNQAGAQRGDLAFSLAWEGRSDLDLHVTCPTGQTVYFRQKAICSGQLDVDANAERQTSTPVENIYFNGPAGGTYRIRVNLYRNRSNGRPEPFQVQIRDQGEVTTLNGVVQNGRVNWTSNYTTRGN